MARYTSIAVTLLSSQAMLWSSALAGFASSDWVHTTYSNGVTTIAVAEHTEKGQYHSRYQTVVNGQPLAGWLGIDRIQRDKTFTYLSGTFSDTCTGQISIRRPNPESGLPIVAQVTWVVTRQPVNFRPVKPPNQDCEVPVGQKFRLNLPEALPRPDHRGEFTNANSNTFLSDNGAIYTWTQWQVVSTDGYLNCRDRPAGAVKHSYRTGQILGKLGREMLDGRNLLEMPDGSSWLKTQKKCYVRASDRFLKPVSLPRKNW